MSWLMRRLMARGGYMEGADDGTGQGTSTGGGAPKPEPKETARELFSREYVQELREENGRYRTKAKEAEEKAARLEAEAAEKVTAAEKRAQERIIRAEIKAEAIKAGIVDVDGLALADLSKVTIKDDGGIDGAEAAIKALKEAKPYLFAAASTSSTEPKPKPEDTGKPKLVTEMTKEEYTAHKRKMGIR